MRDSDELLAIRAAELYYEEDRTQEYIGRALGVTRWKVGRLLQQAKHLGFVRIEIVHPRARRLNLERRLVDTYNLNAAIVVASSGVSDPVDLTSRAAQAAADYLTTLRPKPKLLGVSWGRTLHEVASKLQIGWSSATNVVQINGGVSMNSNPGTAAALAVAIAQKGGGQAALLPSPAILERRETHQAIVGDRVVAGVLSMARSANVFLFSAGQADHDSAHVDSGYLTTKQMDALVAKGAVGDVVGRYIDSDGRIVDTELNERTVGLSLDELRRAQHSIAVIAGGSKHAVARAVVRSGLCTTFITDEATALALLAIDGNDGIDARNSSTNNEGDAE